MKSHKEIFDKLRGDSPRSSKFSHLKSIPLDEITANDIAEWLDKNSSAEVAHEKEEVEIQSPTIKHTKSS